MYRVYVCFLVLAITGLWAMPFGDFGDYPFHMGLGMGMGMPGMGIPGMGMPGYAMGMGAYNPLMGSSFGGMNPWMMNAMWSK
ncbi:hypothetical protein DPMN_186970 [Dreissena polymorpha]|uniref:Uncharacterized protein n=1 Tax=Dreissena polymorpha TaxID=45954 RepID=A0A9D4DN52_DREPO|nr:hypothetical protein DPMN_186956 [Dreissena polymorpha]KAH3752354.1 hypothetical protein DPMN_186970 [Dreissena polymorpha]